MESLSLFLYIIIVFLGLFSIFKRNGKTLNLPPGPRPLPIIGNLLALGDMPHESLANLAKIYGPIMSLKLGQKTEFLISSPTIAKEIFQKQDLIFSTRSMPSALQSHDNINYSLAWMPVSQRWRILRKILKTVIFQTNKLSASENLRREKMHDLIAYDEKCCQEGVVVDIGRVASSTLLNMLSKTMFSVDLPEGLLKEMDEVISNIMITTGKKNLADFFPVLEKFDPQGVQREMTNCLRKMLKIISELVDKRIESGRLKNNNDMNNLLDNLLNMGEDISRTQIEYLLMVLIFAYFLYYLPSTRCFYGSIPSRDRHNINHNRMGNGRNTKQFKNIKKTKIGLEEIIGIGKTIDESDVAKLPYLRAVVAETLRKHHPGPLLTRTVEANVEISGYIIPKGSRVQVNLWAMSRDPALWKSPNSFEPKRFMDSGIDFQAHDFEYPPFGIGRRSCPGAPLASRIIPVMIGSLINSFDWKFESDIIPEELDMAEKYGFTLRKAQPLRVIPISI